MAYEPRPRKYEVKKWCYEMYWGSRLSCSQMASLCPSDPSEDAVHESLCDMGIPRRPSHYHHDWSNSDVLDAYALPEEEPDTLVWGDVA